MTFLANPLRLTPEAVVKYVLALPKSGLRWAPKGVTWHNAGAPNLTTWGRYSDATKQAWGKNYNFYCNVTQHWHSGPHGMGTPDGWAYILCDLLADGVHASCFNHDHFGEETVGDFSHGVDDPLSGPGLVAMQSSANTIASICAWLDFDPDTAINFHRQCAQDHHACPGDLVTDAWAKGLVKARLAEIKDAGPNVVTDSPTIQPAKIAAPAPPTPPSDIYSQSVWLQNFVKDHGVPGIVVDGDIGGETIRDLVTVLWKAPATPIVTSSSGYRAD